MAELISTMPQLPLTYGCSAVFEAIDPTTGDPVTGVVIIDPVIYGYNLTPDEPEPAPTVPAVAPIFVPIPPDELTGGDEGG